MEALWHDVRYSLRSLLASPVYTVTAVLVLGLGVGANTALLSLVRAVFFYPLPVRSPQELVNIYRNTERGRVLASLSYADYADLRKLDIFVDALGHSGVRAVASSAANSEVTYGEFVTSNYFELLGVAMASGRTWTAEEARTATPVVVISYGAWKSLFQGDLGRLGQPLRIDGRAFTVVGVAAETFQGLTAPGVVQTKFWIPIEVRPLLDRRTDLLTSRDTEILTVKARLRPGVTVSQAHGAVRVASNALERSFPSRGTPRQFDIRQTTSVRLHESVDRYALPVTLVVMAIAGMVLVVACCNLVHLVLARSTARVGEIATRHALGASRLSLLRLLSVESIVLGTLGAAAGLGLTVGVRMLSGILAPPPLRAVTIRVTPVIDDRVLGTALGLTLLTMVLVGLVPALRVSRPDLGALVGSAGTPGATAAGRRRLRYALVVPQVAISLFLLLVGGLFVRSLLAVAENDPGFDVDRTALIALEARGQGQPRSEDILRTFVALVEEANRVPGIQSAGLIDRLPIGPEPGGAGLLKEEDGAGRPIEVGYARVDTGAFEALGLSIKEGRALSNVDAGGPAVAVISESGARRLWPNENAIGRRFRLQMARSRSEEFVRDERQLIEVVGVASDTDVHRVGNRTTPMIYVHIGQDFSRRAMLVVRGSVSDPIAVLPQLRQVARAFEPGIVVVDARRVADYVGDALFLARAAASIMGTLGMLGTGIACVGIYGVIGHMVQQRTRELAIRRTLGAGTWQLTESTLGEGLGMVGLGMATGCLAFAFLSQFLDRFLFGISPLDPITVVGIPMLLLFASSAACWLAARHALTTNAATALRQL